MNAKKKSSQKKQPKKAKKKVAGKAVPVKAKKKSTKAKPAKKVVAKKSKRKRTVQKPKPLFSTSFEGAETELTELPTADQIDREIEREEHDENLLDGLTNKDVQDEADDYLKNNDENSVEGQ